LEAASGATGRITEASTKHVPTDLEVRKLEWSEMVARRQRRACPYLVAFTTSALTRLSSFFGSLVFHLQSMERSSHAPMSTSSSTAKYPSAPLSMKKSRT
jgi:hypothetical protein